MASNLHISSREDKSDKFPNDSFLPKSGRDDCEGSRRDQDDREGGRGDYKKREGSRGGYEKRGGSRGGYGVHRILEGNRRAGGVFRGGQGGGGRGGDGYRGGRGGGGYRGGRGGGGYKEGRDVGGGDRRGQGGKKIVVEHHQVHENVFICPKNNEDLFTMNLVPGVSVYNEKRVTVEKNGKRIEYRTWNPYRSKLSALIIKGAYEIYMKKGSRVLYLGASYGITVSHVSDIVGSEGIVYAIEKSERAGRELLTVAIKRTNIIPIIGDARLPHKYRMLVGMVDVIFSDVAQPDQSNILALNAQLYLKYGGHFIYSIKANCIDSTASTTTVYENERETLSKDNLNSLNFIDLEPYEKNQAVLIGTYNHTN